VFTWLAVFSFPRGCVSLLVLRGRQKVEVAAGRPLLMAVPCTSGVYHRVGGLPHHSNQIAGQ
jgi:hypothetical protein